MLRKQNRKPGDHKQGVWSAWTNQEVAWLTDNWGTYAFVKDLCHFLPRHTVEAIVKKAHTLHLPKKVQYGSQNVFPQQIWWALQKQPMGVRELQDYVGCSRSAVDSALQAFRKAKVVYIHHWVQVPTCKGHWRAFWVAGDGLSAKKPKSNGRLRDQTPTRLTQLQGNPFGLLVLESERIADETSSRTERELQEYLYANA